MYGPPMPSEACCSRLFGPRRRGAGSSADRRCGSTLPCRRRRATPSRRRPAAKCDRSRQPGRARPEGSEPCVRSERLLRMEERRRETAHGLIQKTGLGRPAGAGLRIGILWHDASCEPPPAAAGGASGADAVAGQARAAAWAIGARVGIPGSGAASGLLPRRPATMESTACLRFRRRETVSCLASSSSAFDLKRSSARDQRAVQLVIGYAGDRRSGSRPPIASADSGGPWRR